MGTNYYYRKHKGDKCTHCGRGEEYEELHIGKSSMGWKFAFDTWHGEFLSFKDWKKLLETDPTKLFDEYGRNVPLAEFYEKVENKQDGIGLKEYYERYPKHKQFDYDHTQEFYDDEGYNFRKYSDFS